MKLRHVLNYQTNLRHNAIASRDDSLVTVVPDTDYRGQNRQPGPGFFAQKRIGIYKTHFSMVKFRTISVKRPSKGCINV